jgi:hypothetical protein
MPYRTPNPMTEPFAAAAEAVAQARPDVDLEIARELLDEAATMLHNGLALDGLDEHDASAVVAGLATDLTALDPSAAVWAHAQAVLEEPGDLHDADGVSAAYLSAAAILQL